MSHHQITTPRDHEISSGGFTLFETLIATGILVTVLAGVAQLFILTGRLTQQASIASAALAAAQEKLEVLSDLAFDYDPAGLPVTDPLLDLSPASSLDEDLDPYVDWVDVAGEASASPDDAVFARRWRITSIASGEPDVVTIEVCVFRMPAATSARAADACLSTVRTRQP